MELTIATWGPPAIVLLVGAVGGLAYSLRRALPWDHDPRMADLRARRELLMRRLRDLDADRGKLGDRDYDTQRAELVQETATVLRQLEEGLDAPKPEPAKEDVQGGGWMTALGAVLFLVAAGIALQQGVTDRADAPMTGGSSSGGAAAVMPVVQEAQDTLKEDPTNAQALCTLRKYALYTRDLDGAMSLMETSQQAHPDDPCVVTHMAALKLMIGRFDEANAEIAALGSTAPNEAQIWQAILIMQTSEDTDPAKDLLRSAVKNADDSLERDFASYLLSSLMMPPAQMASPGAGPSGPQAGGGPAVTGTIQGELEPGGVLYIYIRSSEAERGPPLAALQLKEWQLPMEFDLSQATVIRSIPEEFYVSAKLSRSGDPMTTGPNDALAAPVGPVKAGESIQLTLQ